jgi:ketosteroid isomerase-like protein
MSQANKEIAAQFFAALGAGDAQAMRGILHPDIVAIAKGTSILSGQRNFEEIIGALGMLSAFTQNGIAFRLISMTAEDDRVSAETEGFSTLKNGEPYNNFYHMLFTFRDGKIVGLNEYFCTKMADAALGPLLAGG